ncbi:hypothetical protein [Nocardiopsis lambiniae]|uniref:Methyl-accepting chemotaxis protein n=1 Tax=Nocardiopsis lambiniae TaxID=3075539 RepID=A0ABU2M3H5_9ACTN|nr:hypothetical protein [Nocardiopsis sp. DSM 44743]MDT0326861.1 hypothetical protein [Nocardiopsis sp. DSM 44743]
MKTEIMLGDESALVEELRSLAAEERLSGRAVQLSALAADLESRSRLEIWSEIDLGASFPAAESIGPSGTKGVTHRILDVLPAGLVFLPVLITWAGLAMAAGAHGRSHADPALQGLSFLERWQNGFNGALPGWLAFDQVAYYTLAGILMLIGTVLVQGVRRRRFEAQDTAERTDLARRLTSAMTAARFILGPVRLGHPARIADELGTSVNKLRKVGQIAERAQEDVRAALAETRKEMHAAQETILVLREGSDGVTAAVREGLDVVRDLYTRLGEVSEAIDRVADASDELTRTADEERVRTREELSGLVGDLSGRVHEVIVDGQERLSTAVSDSAATIGRALTEGETGLRASLDEWREVNTIFAHRNESAGDLAGRVAEIVGELPLQVERLKEGIDALREVMEVGLREPGGVEEPEEKDGPDPDTGPNDRELVVR